jgi:hypothetical protein
LSTLVHLGCCDSGVSVDWSSWFKAWNPPVGGRAFRDERLGKWRRPKTLAGTPVKELQEKLRTLGFMPCGPIDGICGYRTRASIRLFQEYVYTVEGDTDIGAVDGMAGRGVWTRIDQWLAANKTAQWADPLDGHGRAIKGLRAAKAYFEYAGVDTPGISLVNQGPSIGVTSTLRVEDWDFDPAKIHLIGVRRKENEVKVQGTRHVRELDDLFILLVNGMRFTFLGSTDPMIGERTSKPFILRGQHRYATMWHKQTDQDKVYRAWKPRDDGVLVVRTKGKDGILDEADYDVAAPEINNSINIHWSGIGTSNWSAGCQVIAGAKYLDFRGELIDCEHRAARNYSALSGTRTKAAYNVLSDLVTVFSADASITGDGLLYTLLFEADTDVFGVQGVEIERTAQALHV